MGLNFGKITYLGQDDQLIITNLLNKELVVGPKFLVNYSLLSTSVIIKKITLNNGEYIGIKNTNDPSLNRNEFGPIRLSLTSPYESYENVKKCPVLDRNDYIIVTNNENGEKKKIPGPLVYRPKYNEVLSEIMEACIIPHNKYIIVNDPFNKDFPIIHKQGPQVFFPEPSQEINKINNKIHFYDCIEITYTKGIYLQLKDGSIILKNQPMFYMLEVGEKINKYVEKIILNPHEFCIITNNNGDIRIMDGSNKLTRSFFLEPFENLIEFNIDNSSKTILSILPQIIEKKFTVLTSDNISIEINFRIYYNFFDIYKFGNNFVDYDDLIINWCQQQFSTFFRIINLVELTEIKKISNSINLNINDNLKHFEKYGIKITEIGIIDFEIINTEIKDSFNKLYITCIDSNNKFLEQKRINELSDQEIENNKKRKNVDDVIYDSNIQSKLRQKELDSDYNKKIIDLEILEEEKRQELLNITNNISIEQAKIEGIREANKITSFYDNLPEMTSNEKFELWKTVNHNQNLDTFCSKVNNVNCISNENFKLMHFGKIEN